MEDPLGFLAVNLMPVREGNYIVLLGEESLCAAVVVHVHN